MTCRSGTLSTVKIVALLNALEKLVPKLATILESLSSQFGLDCKQGHWIGKYVLAN